MFDESGELVWKEGKELGGSRGGGGGRGWVERVGVGGGVEVKWVCGLWVSKVEVVDGVKEVKVWVG